MRLNGKSEINFVDRRPGELHPTEALQLASPFSISTREFAPFILT
jgi:hypothetical protein